MARAPFKLNATVMQAFLEGPTIRKDLERRAMSVAAQARTNAAGNIIGIETGDLINGIRYTIDRDLYGLYAIIGTNATHNDFAYPAYHDQHGRPWLTSALRDAWDD